MPADDKSPPPERVEPTVCLIKPKGRDRAGHTARERGRQRQIEEEKNPSFFHLSSSQAAIGLQDMTARLDLMPLFLIFLLSSHLFSFYPGDEKMLASLFLSLCLSFYFFLQTPTPLSMKTTTNLHNWKQLKTENRLFLFSFSSVYFLFSCSISCFFLQDLLCRNTSAHSFHGTIIHHHLILLKWWFVFPGAVIKIPTEISQLEKKKLFSVLYSGLFNGNHLKHTILD